jgi:hypothetical protein
MVMELVMRVTRRNAEMTFRSRVSSAMELMPASVILENYAFLLQIRSLVACVIAMMIPSVMMETRAPLILVLMILSVFSLQMLRALMMVIVVLRRFVTLRLAVNPIRYPAVEGKGEAVRLSSRFQAAGMAGSMT